MPTTRNCPFLNSRSPALTSSRNAAIALAFSMISSAADFSALPPMMALPEA